MSWFTKSPPSAKWHLTSAKRSPFEPRKDGGLSFSANAGGDLLYKWLYVTIHFAKRPSEAVWNRFSIRRGQDEHAGELLGYTQKDDEVTLCFTGDWANVEGLSIGDENQTEVIAEVANAGLPF
ncbi:MAG: hypothetical protein Q8K55_05010 [Gemmatimonadaceae bacterium]|nr:hypothetical protein [Gemmatimonadaceae bacterium]